MPQSSYQITYSYTDGSAVSHDISQIDEITVDYLDAPGGSSGYYSSSGNGGRVEGTVVDVSDHNDIYIWVGGSSSNGRYNANNVNGGGSTEISFVNTDASDSADEPFIVAAGGGGHSAGYFGSNADGARGGNAEGTPPPQGGDGSNTDALSGDGAVASIPEVTQTGTITEGGGGGTDTDGEVQITYSASVPSSPSNVQISASSSKSELTVSWDEQSAADGYYVYRAETSGTNLDDYTLIADVTSSPYTDTAIEYGKEYNYRISSHV